MPDRKSIRKSAAVLVTAAALAAWPIRVRVVSGGSMAPALYTGDVCLIDARSRAPRAGEVVLFERAGWPAGVLHRVESVLGDGAVVTRGDANPVADLRPVRRAEILGECVWVLPVGRAAHFLASRRDGTLPGQSDSQRR